MANQASKIMIATSAGDWEGIQHRPHHFMKRAAKSNRTVIYVDPPVTLLGPLKNKNLLANWKRWLKGLVKVEENLFVLSPPPTLPFGSKYRFINKINQFFLSKSIKKELSTFNGEDLELYSFLPGSVDLIKHIPFNNVYYDCVDDHASFTGLINPKVIHTMEKELVEKADVCFATASQLIEDRKEWSTNFHLIPNGAEYEHFAVVQEEKLLLPSDMENIAKPIIGFYGGISDWINLDIIADAARKLTECSFVLLGPIDTDISQFKDLANVHFLGSKQYNRLPNYIQQFDICLISFKINKLTKSVNPIKMYEYLSSGKPVISTPLQEVLHYRDVIEIVTNSEELLNAISRIIDVKENFNSPEAIKKRQKVGKENSWDSRWEKVLSLIGGSK
ncbi:glycosyltransferase [Bacillus sp. EB600]|uniref:glycosyltransferase n=1 Tax=Bacillus sp. EB600 TaxID=2806345 RepID=UPI002108FCC1|nr:glycosyltransferase [Bacillus sp. EB600]MCQ6278672.1 glycosyltransferase [Bacillus sp. EB600]